MMAKLFVFLFACLSYQQAVFSYSTDTAKPNIIILLADDLGWNDVGYHGASNIETPNIDRLANNGLRLESHYVMPLCSPTRAALLSGRYPIHIGIQSAVFKGSDTYGLSIDQPILPETLKNDFGYKTAMIGKWHLGYAAWQYTPTYRGFDSFFGFYMGEQDKYEHSYSKGDYSGYDLRDGVERADMDLYDGYYSAWLEGNHTLDKLHELSKDDDPFFMYLAYSTPHKPVQAPDYTVEKYQDVVEQDTRREYSAMVDILDDVIGNVMKELRILDMWDNTLVIFMSDNGAERSIGDNFPLCGNKNMLYEGGTRSPTFITGGYLNSERRGEIMDNHATHLMHVTDWYPTIISLIDSNGDNDNAISTQNTIISAKSISNNDDYIGDIDGINQWKFINGDNNDVSMRTTMLYNIDPNLCVASTQSDASTTSVCGAVRKGEYKYIIANRNDYTSWNNLWQSGKPSVDCGDVAKRVIKNDIDSDRCESGCLFDLSSDPCELFDISENDNSYDDIVNELDLLLREYYNNGMNDPLEMKYESDETNADPNNNDGFWEPWIDLDEQIGQRNPYLKLSPKKSGMFEFGVINNGYFSSKLDNTSMKYIVVLLAIIMICSIFVCASYFKHKIKKKSNRNNEEFSPLLRL